MDRARGAARGRRALALVPHNMGHSRIVTPGSLLAALAGAFAPLRRLTTIRRSSSAMTAVLVSGAASADCAATASACAYPLSDSDVAVSLCRCQSLPAGERSIMTAGSGGGSRSSTWTSARRQVDRSRSKAQRAKRSRKRQLIEPLANASPARWRSRWRAAGGGALRWLGGAKPPRQSAAALYVTIASTARAAIGCSRRHFGGEASATPLERRGRRRMRPLDGVLEIPARSTVSSAPWHAHHADRLRAAAPGRGQSSVTLGFEHRVAVPSLSRRLRVTAPSGACDVNTVRCPLAAGRDGRRRRRGLACFAAVSATRRAIGCTRRAVHLARRDGQTSRAPSWRASPMRSFAASPIAPTSPDDACPGSAAPKLGAATRPSRSLRHSIQSDGRRSGLSFAVSRPGLACRHAARIDYAKRQFASSRKKCRRGGRYSVDTRDRASVQPQGRFRPRPSPRRGPSGARQFERIKRSSDGVGLNGRNRASHDARASAIRGGPGGAGLPCSASRAAARARMHRILVVGETLDRSNDFSRAQLCCCPGPERSNWRLHGGSAKPMAADRRACSVPVSSRSSG